jgi:hypothetical protein
MQERNRQSSVQAPNSSKTKRPANEKRRKRVPFGSLTFAYFESTPDRLFSLLFSNSLAPNRHAVHCVAAHIVICTTAKITAT